MDRSDIIFLISVTRQKDSNGLWVETEEKRQVYCQVDSIRQSEFFEAGRNGLNPEYRFTMFSGDYNGETIVEYHDQTYSVYRTYLTRSDNIELYVERKGGTNGKQTNQS